MDKKKTKAFIVLGMHRSATSLVAGGLDKMDINMGEQMLLPNSGNTKGYFENADFILLNDEILSEAGGSWDNPPSGKNILALKNKYEDKIKAIIEKNKSECWGWKDPRTVLTIDLYMPYLKNPFFFICFRNPVNVAASLYKRDKMPIEKGIELAKEYNKRLIQFINK